MDERRKYIIIISILFFLPVILYSGYYPLNDIIKKYNFEYYWDWFTGRNTLKLRGIYISFFPYERKIYFNRKIVILNEPPVRKDGIIYVSDEFIKLFEKQAKDIEICKQKEKEELKEKIIKKENKIEEIKKKKVCLNRDNKNKPEINNKNTIYNKISGEGIKVIIIDAGHGGNDPGAIGQRGLREKVVVLYVAKELKKILERELKGVKVILTRKDDRFLTLKQRASIANKYMAKYGDGIFISIHANASYNKRTKGVETYVLSPVASDDEARAVAAMENGIIEPPKKDNQLSKILTQLLSYEFIRESYELANFIQKGYRKYLPSDVPDRGVRKARFYVLEKTLMPGVLTEIGYITNKKEESRMRNKSYLKKIAYSIADGIKRFIQWYNQGKGFIQ